jgi:anti-sigma B factor antagonist
MDDALAIEVRQEPGCTTVTAAGEIDISTVTRLRERLFEAAASGHPLVVDLNQVSFIDSVGLALLVGTANRAAAHGGSLRVACARPKIRQLLHLTGLDRRIPLAHTLDEALQARAATPTNRHSDLPASPLPLGIHPHHDEALTLHPPCTADRQAVRDR